MQRDDPMLVLSALTADIGVMNQTLKMMSENTDRRLNALEEVLKQYIPLSQTVNAVQVTLTQLVASVAKNETRIESIDVLKKEMELVKASIIPEGNAKFEGLRDSMHDVQDDFKDLQNEFKDFKKERWKWVTATALSLLSLAGLLFKDYGLPLLQTHFH